MSHLMRETDGSGPREIKGAFEDHPLEDFAILSLDFTAAAVCIATVRLTVGRETYERPLRLLHENDQGHITPAGRPGDWRLMTWGAASILQDV